MQKFIDWRPGSGPRWWLSWSVALYTHHQSQLSSFAQVRGSREGPSLHQVLLLVRGGTGSPVPTLPGPAYPCWPGQLWGQLSWVLRINFYFIYVYEVCSLSAHDLSNIPISQSRVYQASIHSANSGTLGKGEREMESVLKKCTWNLENTSACLDQEQIYQVVLGC